MDNELYELDIARLKQDLTDYYGTAMVTMSDMAIIELIRIENATPEELINIAQENNFELNNYLIKHNKWGR